ncbi:uncharacterized protein LOC125829337 [Solanum verrucosum]|uniref:uncharacterized protein LOC125829337 n=1 Tax=Solanum verrucosum TaxID=315347 RepID=UPI0020D0B094|nr:uncharacterized protein LOC125829337 [Solanum verrucosum]
MVNYGTNTCEEEKDTIEVERSTQAPKNYMLKKNEENPRQSTTEELQIGKERAASSPKLVKPLPKINPPFPQRLKKRNDGEKFKKILSVFKSLSINLPLVEALVEMPGYMKFMKELFPKELYDLGASINLMPYAIFMQLGFGEPKSTTMLLLMADPSIKHPTRILYDILVKVDRFIFPGDLVILDCDIDAEVHIIMCRPFLATRRALVDVESGELKFRVNEEEVTFNVCKSLRQPSDIHVISTIDMIDEAMANVS